MRADRLDPVALTVFVDGYHQGVGTTRCVWSPERYSAVEWLDRDAVERMLTYCQTQSDRGRAHHAEGLAGPHVR